MRPARRTKIVTIAAAIIAATATVSATNQDDTTTVAVAEPVPATYPPAPVADPVPTRHARLVASLAVSVPRVVTHTARPKVKHHAVKRKVAKTTHHTSYAKPTGWMQTFAKCVQRHESHGNYRAENPTSTASGAYQFIDGTWRGLARHLGFGQYSHASYAPPALQDRAFFYSISHGGIHNWNGTHCGYGT